MEFGVFLLVLFTALFAPFLLSLFSGNAKFIMAALLCSVMAVLLSTEGDWAFVPWTIGLLLAAYAIFARLAAIRRANAGTAGQPALPASLVTYHRLPYG